MRCPARTRQAVPCPACHDLPSRTPPSPAVPSLPCLPCLATHRPAEPCQPLPRLPCLACLALPRHTCHALPGLAKPCHALPSLSRPRLPSQPSRASPRTAVPSLVANLNYSSNVIATVGSISNRPYSPPFSGRHSQIPTPNPARSTSARMSSRCNNSESTSSVIGHDHSTNSGR